MQAQFVCQALCVHSDHSAHDFSEFALFNNQFGLCNLLGETARLVGQASGAQIPPSLTCNVSLGILCLVSIYS